jgi:hypothetical protein
MSMNEFNCRTVLQVDNADGFDYDFEHDSESASKPCHEDVETSERNLEHAFVHTETVRSTNISDADDTLASFLAKEAIRENISPDAAKVLSELATRLKLETTEEVFHVERNAYTGPVMKNGSTSSDWIFDNQIRSRVSGPESIPIRTQHMDSFTASVDASPYDDMSSLAHMTKKDLVHTKTPADSFNSNDFPGQNESGTRAEQIAVLARRLRIFYTEHMPIRAADAEKIAGQFVGDEGALNAMLRLKYGLDLSNVPHPCDTEGLPPPTASSTPVAAIPAPLAAGASYAAFPSAAVPAAAAGESKLARGAESTDLKLAEQLASARREEGDLLWEAHQASMSQLQQMTPAQRIHARDQLRASLDPKMLALLHKRAARRRSTLLAGPSPDVAAAARASVAEEMVEEGEIEEDEEDADEEGEGEGEGDPAGPVRGKVTGEGGKGKDAARRDVIPSAWRQGPDDGCVL